MKLTWLGIKNFRVCQDVVLQIGNMHALVGANNAGKSTVLRALDFLLNPSKKMLNRESFWNMNTTREISVEAIFSDLTPQEKREFGSYLDTDGTFHMARIATMDTKNGSDETEADQSDAGIVISQKYKKNVPEVEWLREDDINAARIKEWWGKKEDLVVGDINFSDGFKGERVPQVGEWKEKAAQFVEQHIDKLPMVEKWMDNPKGYANVLKKNLPFFVFVPAVRDVTEESKGAKTSPFGKLLYAITDMISEEKRESIERILSEISKQMNRSGGDDRVSLIADAEKHLNFLLNDFFVGCDLEIEFETPTLEVLLSSPKLYIDDGIRNAVENKGHGLQRAVIFTILRSYAEHVTADHDGKKRTLILGIEEPELYMHPQAQRTIRRVFRKISGGGDQILFSTHSSLLVEVEHFDEIVRMETVCDDGSCGRTKTSTAWQLTMERMIDDIKIRFPKLSDSVTPESIRDRYSHVYNPRRNEGFFASKIVLVEGATEEYCLPIYADSISNCSFDPLGISVVECGGKDSIDRLFRIFNELHIPCYVIFDYDNSSTVSNSKKQSQFLLSLVGKPVECPGDVYVDDVIAFFPDNWESTLREEVGNIDALTQEARKVLGLRDDTGKPLIARYIARKLIAYDPPQVPDTIRKIIERAVSVKWTASCLKC
ncbi:MAG: ATP-dependent endonuclease [Deltaproteobacteria bacterium]|nr:ATP-dependent endonuclease [Deltaproteobacteria bacterium]